MSPIPLRRLALCCLASLALYAGLFGFVLDRPLSHGLLTEMIDIRLARAAAIDGPKLVILAGSNGLYSHRCETIEPILKLPCVNGGIAVGIGLDYLFTRWGGVLHAGDVVYLPMEQAQYVRGRATSALGPDAAILFRHDWPTLAQLAPRRWIAAMFAFDFRAGVMSVVETALLLTHAYDPHLAQAGTANAYTNAWGDHIGHTAALAEEYRATLAAAHGYSASAAEIAAGDGTAEIARFVAHASARGIRVVGGLPTGFADVPPSEATVEAIQSVYTGHGGQFLALPNRSRYPRADFFDSPDHLNEMTQQEHSRSVAVALSGLLGGKAQIQALAIAPR